MGDRDREVGRGRDTEREGMVERGKEKKEWGDEGGGGGEQKKDKKKERETETGRKRAVNASHRRLKDRAI